MAREPERMFYTGRTDRRTGNQIGYRVGNVVPNSGGTVSLMLIIRINSGGTVSLMLITRINSGGTVSLILITRINSGGTVSLMLIIRINNIFSLLYSSTIAESKSLTEYT